jgi:hypothetical protein
LQVVHKSGKYFLLIDYNALIQIFHMWKIRFPYLACYLHPGSPADLTICLAGHFHFGSHKEPQHDTQIHPPRRRAQSE